MVFTHLERSPWSLLLLFVGSQDCQTLKWVVVILLFCDTFYIIATHSQVPSAAPAAQRSQVCLGKHSLRAGFECPADSYFPINIATVCGAHFVTAHSVRLSSHWRMGSCIQFSYARNGYIPFALEWQDDFKTPRNCCAALKCSWFLEAINSHKGDRQSLHNTLSHRSSLGHQGQQVSTEALIIYILYQDYKKGA